MGTRTLTALSTHIAIGINDLALMGAFGAAVAAFAAAVVLTTSHGRHVAEEDDEHELPLAG